MKIFGIEIKREKKEKVFKSIVDKLTLSEHVASQCANILQVETLLIYFIYRNVMKSQLDDELSIFEVYDNDNLENNKQIQKAVGGKKEYAKLLSMTKERYLEINNPVNKMVFTEESLAELKELSDKYGNNKIKS